MKVEALKLGLDIGNSRVKGALLNGDNRLKAIINTPSAITHIQSEEYVTFSHAGDQYIRVVESALEHYDDILAIGDKAIDLPDYREFDVESSSYKTNHPMTTSLLFGTFAAYIEDETEIDLKVAVSIPIVESKTIGLTKQYKSLLEGTHVIDIFREGETRRVTINIVRAVVTNEGQAGFFGLMDMVDKSFRGDITSVYQSLGEDEDPLPTLEHFLVCDIGEGTTDISVFRNKKFNPDYSFSITQGIGNLLEGAIADAQRKRLTIESRKDLQRVIESTNKRGQKRRDQWMAFVEPKEDAFIQTIIDTIVKAYGNRDYFDAIIFFGGGFSALTGYDVDMGQITIRNPRLFDELEKALGTLNKTADLMFGVPIGQSNYSQTINQRGLMQVLTGL